MKSYVIVIKTIDKRYSFKEPFYRIDFKICYGFRELREYILKCGLSTSEYVIYEETDMQIKKVAGKAL